MYGFDKKKGTIIVNVECSKAVEEQLCPLGYSIKYIQVGHTYLTLHAKKEHAPLGIESSGHIIIPSYFLFDDALLIPLKIAEILDNNQKTLYELQQEIPIYPRKKLEIPCDDETKFSVISKLKKKLQQQYKKVNTLDGIRIELEDGWALIRASNTSPIIRLTVEADNQSALQKIIKNFQTETESLITNA